jgi:zinc protease
MRQLILLLSAACACVSQDLPQPLKIDTGKLPNGLALVMAEDHSRPVVNLQVWYHVGSKNEVAGRTGFAHLFEHLMFRGSKNLGPEEFIRLVNRAGGTNNAYTTFDQTVYWETVPSNYLDQMMWAEADRMASLVINDQTFQKEREVVKEERRMRYENPPYGMLFERVLSNLYQVYPYKHLPIGSMEDLNKATTKDVQEFFNTFYVPNNATVVIVGDFEPKQARAWAEKYFGPIPRGIKPIPRPTVEEPAQTALRELAIQIPNAPIPVEVKAYHLPPLGSPDSYPLEIASAILSAGESSRLYRKLVYEDQVAVAAQGQADFLEGPSFFFLAGFVNQAKADLKAVEKDLQSVIDQIDTQPVPADELEKAKTQILRGFILSRDTMQGKADALGRAAVLLGNPNIYNTELEQYRKVTAADVERVCKKYLNPTNETRLAVTGETKK